MTIQSYPRKTQGICVAKKNNKNVRMCKYADVQAD